MEFQEVLAYIRAADRDTWHLIAEEIRLTTLPRDVQAAWSFQLGQAVSFTHPDGSRRVSGKITKIHKNRGRVCVAADLGNGKLTEVGLLATMVMGLVP